MEARLLIDYGSHEIDGIVTIESGKTALDALEINHKVDGKMYEGMGYFVTGIDDIKSNNDYNWLFFVDGEVAQSSADNIEISDGIEIEFRYLSNEESMRFFE